MAGKDSNGPRAPGSFPEFLEAADGLEKVEEAELAVNFSSS